jgi:ribose transport system permease protein
MVAIGMTYTIITGGIDLSVGSVLALTSLITAILLMHGINMFLAIGVGLLFGVAFGFLNGVLITSRFKMAPFIATLATMSIARGVTLVITKGRPVSGLPEEFRFIGGGDVFGIPFSVILMLLAFAFGHLYLSRSRNGLCYYSVGGNLEASRLAGINVNRIRWEAYMISGFTAALGGMVLASRLTSVEPLSGLGYELDAIAAAVIGGASLSGGQGTIAGTLVGALIMGVLRNGLNLLDVSTYWQQVAIGVVIAVTVSIGTLRKT